MNDDLKTRKKILEDYFMRYLCTDDEDNRRTALSWNANISEEARELHKECIIIDGCSFNVDSFNWQLRESMPTGLNITINARDSSAESTYLLMVELLGVINENPNHFVNILKASDIEATKRANKIGFIMGAQNCDFIQCRNNDAAVEMFARMGLRIMQIAYHTRSFAADGCATDCDAGITNDGKALIRSMQKYGITVDLSHVGRRSTLEAMDYAEKPMIFSHSNPIRMYNHFRNITDEQAKKCAAIGGVIGCVSFAPIFYDGRSFPSVDKYVDTISYYADLIGIDHVGIGLDSNATPGAYNRLDAHHMAVDYFGANSSENTVFDIGYMQGRGKASIYPDGIFGNANYSNIIDKLLKHGFSHEDIKKVMGGNFLRVFKETWIE